MPATNVRNIVDLTLEEEERLSEEERRRKREEAQARRRRVEAAQPLPARRPEPPDERRERIAQDVVRIRGALRRTTIAVGRGERAIGEIGAAQRERRVEAGPGMTPTPTPAATPVPGVPLAQLPLARQERAAVERGELGGPPKGPSLATVGVMAPVVAQLTAAVPALALKFPAIAAFLLEQQAEERGIIPGRPVGRTIEFLSEPGRKNLEELGVPGDIAQILSELVLFGAVGKAPAGQRTLPELVTAARQLSTEDIAKTLRAVENIAVRGERGEMFIGGEDVVGRELERALARSRAPANLSPGARNKLLNPILRQESREVLRTGTAMIHRDRVRKAAALQDIIPSERYGDVEAFVVARGVQRGTVDIPVVSIPEGFFTQADMGEYTRAIRFFDWGRDILSPGPTYEALIKYTSGLRVTPGELKMMARVFGQEILRKPSALETTGNVLFDLFFGLPRTLQTAYDASAVLRQAAFASVRHGREVFGNFPRAYLLSAFNDDAARAINAQVRRVPRELGDDAAAGYDRLFFGEYEAAAGLSQREEMFFSRIAIDGLRVGDYSIRLPGIKESARGYTTYLNKARSDIYLNVARGWQRRTDRTIADYEQLADLINRITGRGGLGPLEGMGDILAAGFYAPRFALSRFQAPLMVFARSPHVRRLAAEELVSFIGVGSAILAAIKMSGAADVELDPRSSNFGRIRVGPTKLDFWAGWQPIARQITQFTLGERKTSSGYIQPAARGNVAWRALQGKFNPGTGFLIDLTQGTTFLGEEMSFEPNNVLLQMYNRLAPLFAQDLADAIRHQGLEGMGLALPGFFGATVLSYETAYDRITAVEDEIRMEHGWTEEQVEDNPGLRALMRQDERWIAVRKDLDEEAKRHGVPLEYRVSGFRREVYDAARGEQETDDQRVEKWWKGEEGGITPREWAARDAGRAAASYNRTQGVQQALDIEYEVEEAVAGTVREAVDNYFAVDPASAEYTDAVTGRVNWDRIWDDREAALAPLSEAERQHALRAIHPNDTELQRMHDRDLEIIRDSGERDRAGNVWRQIAPKKIAYDDLVNREIDNLSRKYPGQHITRAEAIDQLTLRMPEVATYRRQLVDEGYTARMENGFVEALRYKWGEIDKILNPEAAEWYFRWFGRWPDDFKQPPKQYAGVAYERPGG